ncbi:hypothetical protein [Alishewanella longhuensis]
MFNINLRVKQEFQSQFRARMPGCSFTRKGIWFSEMSALDFAPTFWPEMCSAFSSEELKDYRSWFICSATPLSDEGIRELIERVNKVNRN